MTNKLFAFPVFAAASLDSAEVFNSGMELRDYFAAKALQGILSGPCSRDGVPFSEWFDVPEQAYKLADAMLAARTKGSGNE